MSYKVKVTKKTVKKKPETIEAPYYECPLCGYQDDMMGGFCPNGCDTEMDFVYPEKYKSLAEYFLGGVQENEMS